MIMLQFPADIFHNFIFILLIFWDYEIQHCIASYKCQKNNFNKRYNVKFMNIEMQNSFDQR